MSKQFLFVYGTLRSAASNPCENYGATHVGPATLKGGNIYDLGWFPGLKLDDPEGTVVGDIYEVDQSIIPRLDAYEGVPNLYSRRTHPIKGFGDDVFIYEYNGFPGNREKVANGDWLNHVKKETEE